MAGRFLLCVLIGSLFVPDGICYILSTEYPRDQSSVPYSSVRLVNGTYYYNGRVEIYHNGQWGTICDRNFDHNDVMVICRMLGLYLSESYGVPYFGAYYGQGSGPILLNHLGCSGHESRIDQCMSDGWYQNNCWHGQDAGVDCYAYQQETSTQSFINQTLINQTLDSGYEGQVRLRDGGYYYGRLEVYSRGQWGTICDDSFDHNDVKVICRMLGLYRGENYGVAYSSAYYGNGSGPIIVDDLQCYGYESNIKQCSSFSWYSHNCGHGEDAGLDCYAYNYEMTTQPFIYQTSDSGNEGKVRLINGSYYYGRVEVYSRGQWGTICDDSFDHNDVKVICRMLGLYQGENYGVAYSSAYYGSGSGPIIVDDLQCYGYESNIKQCSSSPWFSHNCGHGEDAGLDCYAYNYNTSITQPFIYQTSDSGYEGQVRLRGGAYIYSGRVEIFSRGQWGTICDDDFDHNDVKVICRMLGLYQGENYGVAYSSAFYGSGSGPIIVDDLQCYGYESNIQQCSSSPWFSNNCNHGEDASLDCTAYYNNNQTTSFPTTTYSTYPWWLTSTYPWWHTNQPYTTTYNPWYFHTTPGYTLQDVIRVNCNEYTWSIIVDLNRLRQLYPNAKGSDIYFGENTCVGIERDGHLTFQQGFTECLTTEMLRGDVHVYMNELIYAERDPVYLYIIRHYNWTVNVECDVMRDGSVQGGFQTGTNAPKPSENSLHYPVNISYYLDPNYMQEVSGHPLHADVGSQIYVKVFTTTFDWSVRMRVHTCYTKPTPNAPDHLKYYLLKNGCEADTNTHIISQSTHETRFVFDDFEYTSNHEGLYVFCDVTFCQNQDWSQQCRQTCNPIVKRSVRLTDTKSALLPEK